MSTRPRLSNSTLDEEDFNETFDSPKDLSVDARETQTRNSLKQKTKRRQSRLPRTLMAEPGNNLLTTIVGDEDELSKGSNHSTRSARSPRRQRMAGLAEGGQDRRARRCRSLGQRRRSTGVSSHGGSKQRTLVSDDDTWEIFKEALQNMA
ncbi:expressed unknown protein [Seminavis robusta]|uniref:Uncharacterized protein n=1 Tax=Seminavis robusta TaxID=568900 RepID=A0A9N8D8S8_9STRA|nr:expressed unknown protein [Seminavis robusta]|eukprot:Sro3_g002510.1 n/a (150) ;mRNA; f:184356-184805